VQSADALAVRSNRAWPMCARSLRPRLRWRPSIPARVVIAERHSRQNIVRRKRAASRGSPTAENGDPGCPRSAPVLRGPAHSIGGRQAPVVSPSTAIRSHPADAAARTSIARQAAERFRLWRDTPRRIAPAIRPASAILRANTEELAYLEALDTGNRSRRCSSTSHQRRLHGLFSPGCAPKSGRHDSHRSGSLNYTLREPRVCARIGAFNIALLSSPEVRAPLATAIRSSQGGGQSRSRTARGRAVEGFSRPVFNVSPEPDGRRLVAHAGGQDGFIGSVSRRA